LATLLEAVALWQGLQVRAAFCATERDGVSDSSLYREAFVDFGGPLYTLEWIPAAARRGLERRSSRARLEKFKPLADFDWNWPTAIDRPLVESIVSLDFLESARNVVLVAPGGLGKTMIAKNIAHRAVLAGRSVLFLSAAQLLLDLGGQESARALERHITVEGLGRCCYVSGVARRGPQ
jgi:DNA replication protein DnaC